MTSPDLREQPSVGRKKFFVGPGIGKDFLGLQDFRITVERYLRLACLQPVVKGNLLLQDMFYLVFEPCKIRLVALLYSQFECRQLSLKFSVDSLTLRSRNQALRFLLQFRSIGKISFL